MIHHPMVNQTTEGMFRANMILDDFDHSIFTKKQLKVLKMRAGRINGGPAQTKIAKKLKTSRQDISQCLQRAEMRADKYMKYGKKRIPKVLDNNK